MKCGKEIIVRMERGNRLIDVDQISSWLRTHDKWSENARASDLSNSFRSDWINAAQTYQIQDIMNQLSPTFINTPFTGTSTTSSGVDYTAPLANNRYNDYNYSYDQSYYEVAPVDLFAWSDQDGVIETCMCDRANGCRNRRMFSNHVNPCTNCVHNLHGRSRSFDNYIEIAYRYINSSDQDLYF